MKTITRTVWILSIISLLTDMASEMLYPVMPVYLKTIGFSVLLIGLLEGFAEATAGLSKGYFGKLSDSMDKRVPFVKLGYALSAVSKPMMTFFVYPLWIFFARTVDRMGKGIRTGARDAMLSHETTPQNKAKIFGFHRSMDTFGAVLGPSMALVYLYFYPQDYKTLFLIAFVPGILAVLSSFLLKDKPVNGDKPKVRAKLFSFLNYWKESPAAYRKISVGLLAFALFNSSDVFLLLKAKQAGLNDTWTIALYIFYNLIYALAAFPVGILADRLGLKKVFLSGLILFAIVYLGMGLSTSIYGYGVLFFLYGLYAAATEGVSKAWISNVVEKKDVATAIGNFAGLQSIAAMLASSFTGFMWFYFGSAIAFMTTSFVTLMVVLYFVLVPVHKTEISKY